MGMSGEVHVLTDLSSGKYWNGVVIYFIFHVVKLVEMYWITRAYAAVFYNL
jgi:hypothetical protein